MLLVDRRAFLAMSGLAVAGVATGCRSNNTSNSSERTLQQIGNDLRAVAVDMGQGDLDVLARADARISFALRERGTQKQLTGGTMRVWYAMDTSDVAQGPVEATFHGEGLGNRGVYVARLNLERTGNWIVLAEGRPANASNHVAGNAAYSAVDRVDGPAPGSKAISVASPTTDNPRGVNPICTRLNAQAAPAPCSMHDISLDVALANGKPTVLNIGTPKFCTSQTCGPVIDVIQSAANEFTGRVNFVHVEVFKDDRADTIQRQVLAPAAAAWTLREEPITYWIRTDNTITERVVGPIDVPEVRELTQALLG